MRGKQLDPTDVPVPEGERIFVDKLLRPYQGQGRPASNIQLPGVQDYPEWQPVDPFLERVALGDFLSLKVTGCAPLIASALMLLCWCLQNSLCTGWQEEPGQRADLAKAPQAAPITMPPLQVRLGTARRVPLPLRVHAWCSACPYLAGTDCPVSSSSKPTAPVRMILFLTPFTTSKIQLQSCVWQC